MLFTQMYKKCPTKRTYGYRRYSYFIHSLGVMFAIYRGAIAANRLSHVEIETCSLKDCLILVFIQQTGE